MAFSSVRTIRGRNLAAKVQAGTTQMKFTKFTVGDGTLTGQNQENMTALINQRYTYPVSRLKVQSQNVVLIGMSLTNQEITAGFFFREIGLWAQDPDLGEILFAYANAGTGAEYVDAGSSSNVLEKAVNFDITVSNTAQVTAVIDSSLVYATPQDIADALEEAKDYTDSEVSKIVIPDASITQKGIVQLTNTNTGTSQTLAPTQKALGDHVNNQVAHMTQAQKDQLSNALPKTGGIVTGDITIKGSEKYLIIESTDSSKKHIFITGADGNFYLKRINSDGSNGQDLIKIDSTGNLIWNNGNLNEIKQSGVDRKNELVALINANGGSATNVEDMSALIVKLGNISRTRYKESTATGRGATPGSGDDWITTPAGFYNKVTVSSGFHDPSRLTLMSFSIANTGGSVTVYAIDSAGRQTDVVTFNTANRIFYVSGLTAFVNGAGVANYNSADNVGRYTNSSFAGFDPSGGVRFRYRINSGNVTVNLIIVGNLPCFGG